MHFRGPSALQSLFLWRVTDVFLFDLEQVELLGSKNGTGSRYPDPADKGLSTDLVVLHGIQANQCASSAKTSFAVDCDGAGAGLGKVFFARF